MSSCVCPYRENQYCLRIKNNCHPMSKGCILIGKVKQILPKINKEKNNSYKKLPLICLIFGFSYLLFISCSIQLVQTETNPFSKEVDLVSLKNRALYKLSLDFPLEEKHTTLLDYYFYDKNDEEILQYLILTSYHLQNIFDTKYYLDQLLKINPNNRFARQFKNQREKELKIEYSYRTFESSNFRFYYPNPDIYSVNLSRNIEEKFVFISNDFAYRTSEKIPVIFYGGDNYNKLNSFNYQTAGYFDGKIRLNLSLIDNPYFINIFIHEAVHAVIYHISGRNVPIWFHEGMAQYYEYNKTFNIAIPRDLLLRYIPLQEIETSFNLLNNNQINQAYIQSLLLIKFLMEKYGTNIVFELLDEFGKNYDYNTVYYNILLRDRTSLENDFKSYLNTL